MKRRKGILRPHIGHRSTNPNIDKREGLVEAGRSRQALSAYTPLPEPPGHVASKILDMPAPTGMPTGGDAMFDDEGNLFMDGVKRQEASREETAFFFPDDLGQKFRHDLELNFSHLGPPPIASVHVEQNGVTLNEIFDKLYVEKNMMAMTETEKSLDWQEKNELLVDEDWNPSLVDRRDIGIHQKMAMDRMKDWSSRVLQIGRVSVTRKAGRSASFRTLMVAGDMKGRVGVGFGKGDDIRTALDNALKLAVRDVIWIPLYEGRTLYHDLVGKHNNCKVMIRAAPAGAGNKAGKGVRSILDVLGVRDSTTKVFGRHNPYSIVLATMKAFESYESAQFVALKRGKRLMDVNKVMRDHNTTN